MTDRRADDSPRGTKSPDTGRQVPHDLGAEEALLGAALLSAEALVVLAKQVRPDDFYKPAHGHIAEALTRCYEEDLPADPVTVRDLLQRAGLLEAIGPESILVELQARTPSTSNAARYAAIVHDHATLRRLLASAGAIEEHVYGWSSKGLDDAHAAVLRAQELVAGVASQNGSRAYSALEFADVAALLDGDLPKIDPDFLTRSDGQRLFYAARMHTIQGEPTGGKTWIVLAAIVELLAVGGSALYLDYEDSAVGILGRLLALGAHPADLRDRFVYLKQDGPFGATEKIELSSRLRTLNPDLAVIDGVAEALSREGLSEDRATEVVAWIEKLPRWLTRSGAAVVMLDHVAKDRETRGRWARGSGAKLAAIDGAAYEVVVKQAFSRKRAGRLDLRVAKDRPGGVGAVGEIAATIHVTPHADGERVVLEVLPEQAPTSTADAWKPTILMAKVSEELERSTVPLTARAVVELVGGKKDLVRQAIGRLVSEGWVRRVRNGSIEELRLVTPYNSEGPAPDLPPPPDELFDVVTTEDPGPPPSNVVPGPGHPLYRPEDDPHGAGF